MQKIRSILTRLHMMSGTYKIILGLAIVVVVAGGIGILSLTKNAGNTIKSGNNGDAMSQAEFPNLLKPTSTIKVGTFRYVSPCQAYSLADATEHFSDLGSDGNTYEVFLDTSVGQAHGNQPYDTRCVYYFKPYKRIDQVSLSAEQYTDMSELKDLSAILIERPDAAQEVINKYKVAAGNNNEAKAFVDRMQASMPEYQKSYEAYISYDKAALEKVNTQGLLLPGYQGRPQFIYDNVVYEFEIPAFDDEFNAAVLAAHKRMFDRLEKNLQNKSLDQSPIPTILGDTDTVGESTKILETCTLLSPQLFEKITGRPQNQPVKRFTMPVDVQKDRYGTLDKEKGLVKNNCNRENSTRSGSGFVVKTDSIAVNLETRHAKNIKDATDWLGGNEGTTPIQTDAHQSFILNKTYEKGADTYYFRVGPYVSYVTISTLKSEGLGSKTEQAYGSQEQHINAINLIVAEIKRQL